MSWSILMTIYLIFLIIYSALMGFAVYKVFLFAKNKEFKGYSRRITLGFMISVLSVMLFSFLVTSRYHWDDDFNAYYCHFISDNNCSCRATPEEQKQCEEDQKNNVPEKVSEPASSSLKKPNYLQDSLKRKIILPM